MVCGIWSILPPVFNFLFGWLFARNTRNSGLPDEVKRQHYDDRQASKDERRLPTKPWAEQGQSRGFRILVVILLALVVVAIVVLAISRTQ